MKTASTIFGVWVLVTALLVWVMGGPRYLPAALITSGALFAGFLLEALLDRRKR